MLELIQNIISTTVYVNVHVISYKIFIYFVQKITLKHFWV